MKAFFGRRVVRVFGMLIATIIGLSFIVHSVEAVQGAYAAKKITEKMKTVCVARFLIDVPEAAQVSHGYGSVGGLDIAAANDESENDYADRVREIEREISEKANQDGKGGLETVRKLSAGPGAGSVYVFNRRHVKVLEEEKFVIHDLLSLRGILQFSDVSVTGSIDWVSPSYIEGIISILERIRPLDAGEIPREAGLCLGNAMIQDPYDHGNVESAVMFAGIPGHPDVNIVFSSMSGTSPAPGLLERNADSAAREPLFMRLAFTNLREQKRAINGIPGEELVMRIREPNFTTAYSFQWEARGKQDDIHAPVLKLEMESGTNPIAGGKPVGSSLSESAMAHVWERIVASIRLRPTASRPAGRSTPQPAV